MTGFARLRSGWERSGRTGAARFRPPCPRRKWNRKSSRSEQHWRGSLRQYVLPGIGEKRVDQITTADVMSVLLADDFWHRRNPTPKRARQRIATVMKWAVAQGYRDDNPAGDAIAAALPKHTGRASTIGRCRTRRSRRHWRRCGRRLPIRLVQ